MPLIIEPYQLGKKRGALLRLGTAIAEVAPLPGWSQETLNESVELFFQGNFTPSMAFAIDSLLWQQKAPLFHGSVTLCGLCTDKEIEALIVKGFKTLKFKISGLSLDHIRSLIKAVDGRALVRLDANRSLSKEFALDLLHALPLNGIDFIEEPVKTLDDLIWLAIRSPLPLALDETLREAPLNELLALPSISTWVLKPTLIGGFDRLLMLKKRAEKAGIRPLLSSSLESIIGLCTIAHLATTLGFPNRELGLDTSWLLEENFFTLPREPKLDLSNLSHHPFFQSFRT